MPATASAPHATEFGAFLRYVRTDVYHESTRAFALRIGLSPGYLNRIEQGQVGIPRRSTIERLAGPLSVDLDILLLKAGYTPTHPNIEQEAQVLAFQLSRMDPAHRKLARAIVDLFAAQSDNLNIDKE